MYFNGHWTETAVYDRSTLSCGQSFPGPAIVEEQGATTVMAPGDHAVIDDRNNIVIFVAGNRAKEA